MTNWGIRWVALALLALYIAAGAAVVLWPTPVDRPLDAELLNVLSRLHAHGMPGFVDYMFVEFSANIAMFMPLGFLLVLILPRQMWWVAPATGFAASCAAEVAQALFLPNRFATIEDVISNTSGAILGAVIALAIRAVILSRRTPGSVAVVHALELMPVAT